VAIAGFVGAHMVDKTKVRQAASGAPFTGSFFLSEYMWTSFVLRNPASPYSSKERWFSAMLYCLMAVSVVAFRKANEDKDMASMVWMVLSCSIPVKCLEAVFRSSATANPKAKENNFEQSDSFEDSEEESNSSEEDPVPPPPPPPKKSSPPGPPPKAGRPTTPQEEAAAITQKHQVDAGKQAVGHAAQKARQLQVLQEKLASRPSSQAAVARPQSQQDVDHAKSKHVMAQHKVDAHIQQTEHDAEKTRQMEKLQLAIAARPASSASSRPGSAASVTSVSPASPRAWSNDNDDDEQFDLVQKSEQQKGKLPVKFRYAAYIIGAAIVGGLFFFLYLQLPATGTLTPGEATVPMATCLAASALFIEPLFVLYLIKKAAKNAGAQNDQQEPKEEIELSPDRRQSLVA